MLSTTATATSSASRFDRYTAQPVRAISASIRSQRSARIDMIAILIATAAAVLVRFNIVPGIGW